MAVEVEPRRVRERAPGDRASNASPRPEGGHNRERVVTAQTSTTLSIADLVKEGQEIIVQIAKEPLGQKGARITSHIAHSDWSD